MVVGDDEALGVHDEPRALAPARSVVVAVAGRATPRVRGTLDDGDVHDGGVDALDDVGEVRGASAHRGRRGMDRVHDPAPRGEGAQQTRDPANQ